MWICDHCAAKHEVRQHTFVCHPMDFSDDCSVCRKRTACRQVKGEFHMTHLDIDGPNVAVARVRRQVLLVLFAKPNATVFASIDGDWKKLTDEERVTVRGIVEGRPIDRPGVWLVETSP